MRKLCHSALRRHVPSCLHNPPHATLTIADLIMRKLCHSALRRHVPSCLHNPPLRTTSTFYHFRKFTRLCSAKSTFDLLRDLVYLRYRLLKMPKCHPAVGLLLVFYHCCCCHSMLHHRFSTLCTPHHCSVFYLHLRRTRFCVARIFKLPTAPLSFSVAASSAWPALPASWFCCCTNQIILGLCCCLRRRCMHPGGCCGRSRCLV